MQSGSLNDFLFGKYILCVCEGIAEESIIDLLLDNDKLCFSRKDLINNQKCTRIRNGDRLASEFLNVEYKKDIVILRILDRENEKISLPKVYKHNKHISVVNIVTKPEIEFLHIIAENLENDFEHHKRHQKNLKPSEYCKSHFSQNVKSQDFIFQLYSNNIDKLTDAILSYKRKVKLLEPSHYLSELLTP